MNAQPEFNVYTPSRSLGDRIKRRLVRHQAVRPLKLSLNRPIISLSFDDCPRSAFETALPAMESRGWRGTIYAAMGLCGVTNHLGLHMRAADMKAAYDSGHEIGDHSFSHLDANAVSTEDFLDDVKKNQACLKALDISPSRSFAYPYGEVSFALKKALSQTFDISRGIHDPTSEAVMDLNQAASQRLFSGPDFKMCRSLIKRASSEPTWLILFTHDVRENPSAYGCTPEEFEIILDDIEASGAEVLPVIEALDKIKGVAT